MNNSELEEKDKENIKNANYFDMTEAAQEIEKE